MNRCEGRSLLHCSNTYTLVPVVNYCVAMCDRVRRACGGGGELAALSEPFSKVSSLAPLQNIPARDRGGKYIIPNDVSPRVAECWAGERAGGGIYGQHPGGDGGGEARAGGKTLSPGMNPPETD